MLLGVAAPLAAQPRLTVESAASIDFFAGTNVSNRPQIVIDVSAAAQLSDRWQLYIRPWFRQARPTTSTQPVPAFESEIYQAGVRYERPGDVAVRVDAGFITSPIGLGLGDARPDLNPTILPHLAYLVPMPLFDATVPRVVPISNTYPLGTVVTVSTALWDARAAIVSPAPTRQYTINNDPLPKHTPVFVGGAGITPHIGLRIGASAAYGDYVTASERTRPNTGSDAVTAGVKARGLAMTMVGGEVEYSVAYTKLSAEILRTSFEATLAPAVAYEWFVQGKQTLTPRWFVAARHEGTSAPPLLNGIVPGRRTEMLIVETTAGFRLTPQVTLRGSYYTRRVFGLSTWARQYGVSAVWAARWSR